jgi:hypothetical protein
MAALVGFDERSGSSTYGRILISAPVVATSNLHEWYGVEVIDSAQVTIKAVPAAFLNVAPTTAPTVFDANNATPSNGLSQTILPIAILNDIDGNLRRGNYTVRIYTIAEVTTGIFARTKTDGVFKFCLISKTPQVTITSSCSNRTLRAVDKTNYLGLTSVLRDFSITCVTIVPNVIFQAAATTTDEAQVALSYSNVSYDIKLNIQAQNVQTPVGFTFTQYVSFAYMSQYRVVCNTEICTLISCANTKLSDYAKKTAKNGMLAIAEEQKQSRIIQLIALIGASSECEDIFNQSVEALKLLLGDCKCGCNEDNTPRPLGTQSAIPSVITSVQTAIGGRFVYFFDLSGGSFDFFINPTLLLPNMHYTLRTLNGSTANQLTARPVLPAQIGILHQSMLAPFWKLNEGDSFTFSIVPTGNLDIYQICSM